MNPAKALRQTAEQVIRVDISDRSASCLSFPVRPDCYVYTVIITQQFVRVRRCGQNLNKTAPIMALSACRMSSCAGVHTSAVGLFSPDTHVSLISFLSLSGENPYVFPVVVFVCLSATGFADRVAQCGAGTGHHLDPSPPTARGSSPLAAPQCSGLQANAI